MVVNDSTQKCLKCLTKKNCDVLEGDMYRNIWFLLLNNEVTKGFFAGRSTFKKVGGHHQAIFQMDAFLQLSFL